MSQPIVTSARRRFVIEALAHHLRGIAVTLEEAVREVERDR